MNATDYARSVTNTPDSFSWLALDEHAIARHPHLSPLLDAQTAKLNSRRRTPWHSAGRLVWVLVILVAALAPYITSGILLAGSRADGDEATLLAWATPFAIAHIVLRMVEWVKAARGAAAQEGAEIVFTGFSAFFSALTVWAAWIDATLGNLPGAWWYVALFAIMTFACVASFIMMCVRLGAQVMGTLRVNHSRNPFTAFGAGIAELSDDDRKAITADVSAALDLLLENHVITYAEHAQAITQEIGGLNRWRWSQEQFVRATK